MKKRLLADIGYKRPETPKAAPVDSGAREIMGLRFNIKDPRSLPMAAAESKSQVQSIRDSMNPFKPVYGPQNRPQRGAIGPGGAKFDSGLGATNNNAFSNVPGAALWAQGYAGDPNDAYNLYDNLMRTGGFKAGSAFAPYQGKSDAGGLLSTANNYYATEAEKMDRDNNFLRTIPGQLLMLGLTGGIGAVAGLPAAAIASAAMGGKAGGLKGALAGGLGTFLGGSALPYLPAAAQKAAPVFSFANAFRKPQ